MKQGLLARLAAGEILVADGAIGSLLMARGLESGACPESWNLSRPEVLQEIAGLYLQAGADIVQTNTFGGSPLKLARYGLDGKTEQINRAAVDAVQAAVGESALISGSCGPCGETLKPYGDAEPELVAAGFARQIQALVSGGVDLICIETMTDLAEATLALTAAQDVAPDIPVMATMTFDQTPRGFFTIMGTDIPAAAAGLAAAGADVVGSNCGNGAENMVRIAAELRKHTELPVLIQANAGLPELQDGQVVYRETPGFLARKAGEMIAAGVNIVGGCCGTTPEHIAAVRKVVNARGQTPRRHTRSPGSPRRRSG